MKKKSKVLTIVAIVLIAVIGIGALTGAASSKEQVPIEEEPTQIVVETISPTKSDIIVTGEYIGTVDPNQQVTVYPKVSAEVLSVHFHVGDTVEAGDVLFELDSSTLRNSIAQTQATLANSRAKAELSLEVAKQDLENYQSGVEDGYNSNIMQAEAAVESAEVALQEANATLRSARDAYSDYKDEYGDYDDDYTVDSQAHQLRNARVTAEIKVEAAQLKLQQAEASLAAVKKHVLESAVTVETSVKSAELATDFSASNLSLQQMQSNLQHYTVTSPISGIVEQRNIDPYDMASSQAPTFVISNKDAMTVSYQVSETTWENTQIGDMVQVEKNGQSCSGTVTEISTMVGAANGLYTIKVSVENAPFHLNTGTSVKVFAQMQKAENVYTLPIDAAYFENGSAYVYTYDNGITRKTDVVTGIADTENIEIVSGLTLNDQVIVTWNATLMDGTEVVLLEDAQGESISISIVSEGEMQSNFSEQADEQISSFTESDMDALNDALSHESSDASMDADAENSDASLASGDADHE